MGNLRASKLPEYMVPAAYVCLERSSPLTSNGKLDRGSLPAPDGDAYATQGVVRHRGERRRAKLAGDIWSELLGVDRVGRQGQLFRFGRSFTAGDNAG